MRRTIELAAGAGLLMRTFQPTAERVAVIDAEGGAVVETLDKVHDAGFFAGRSTAVRRASPTDCAWSWPACGATSTILTAFRRR